MTDLDALRAKAAEHQQHLDRNTTYLDMGALAKRWNCSVNTVRAIPMSLLPYINIGTGLTREYRRYHPDDVYQYEASMTGKKRAG